MHFIFTILVFVFLSAYALGEQGTMSTDDNAVSNSPASMSGYESDQDIDLREEEVQLQEEDYDPSMDDGPIEIEVDQEKMDDYNQEVEK